MAPLIHALLSAAGFVEAGDVNAFLFEDQRRTFQSHGFAHNPSVDGATSVHSFVGDLEKAAAMKVRCWAWWRLACRLGG